MKLDTAHRRALGRLRADRLRPWPQARALWPLPLHPPRAAGAVGARARRLAGRRRVRPRRRRGWRRALALRRPGPARGLAARLGRGRVHRADHAVPPPRLLPRHGAGVELDARAARRGRRARVPQPVRLYRRRHAGAGGQGRADDPCRCVEEIGRGARAPTPACPGWPTRRSAGWSTTPPSSPRARCGAGGATTASCSTRPNSAAGPRARSGGWRKDLPGLIAGLPPAARRELALPVPDRLRRPHVARWRSARWCARRSPTCPARSRRASWRARGSARAVLPTAIWARWSR